MLVDRMMRWSLPGLLLGGLLCCSLGLTFSPATAWAQDEAVATEPAAETEANPKGWNEGDPVADLSYDDGNDYAINTLIMFICAVLVIFMQAGFAMVEIGLNSAKNVVCSCSSAIRSCIRATTGYPRAISARRRRSFPATPR